MKTEVQKRFDQALEDLFDEWKAENDIDVFTTLSEVIVIAHGRGYNSESEEVTQTMIWQNGSVEMMLGLLNYAKVRYNVELERFMRGDE